jgi:hypothetical protein
MASGSTGRLARYAAAVDISEVIHDRERSELGHGNMEALGLHLERLRAEAPKADRYSVLTADVPNRPVHDRRSFGSGSWLSA